MNKTTRTNLQNIYSTDRVVQNKAYLDVLKVTEKPVDWAYEVWADLLAALRHPDNTEPDLTYRKKYASLWKSA